MAMQVKHLSLPSELVVLGTKKAKKYGLSLGEYVRHLIIKDVEMVNLPVHKLTAEEEKELGESLKDYHEGRYTTLRTDKDIEKFFMGE